MPNKERCFYTDFSKYVIFTGKVSAYVLLWKYSDQICNLVFMEICECLYITLGNKTLEMSVAGTAAWNSAALFLQSVLQLSPQVIAVFMQCFNTFFP